MDAPNTRCRRPVGVWIATLWAGLFAGLFPLALVLVFYFGPARGAELMSGLQLAFSVVLGSAIIVSAIFTWRGNPTARNFLVVLVVIHYALLAYQNYRMGSSGLEIRGSPMAPWIRAVRAVGTAAALAGYLLFSRTSRDFFGQRPR